MAKIANYSLRDVAREAKVSVMTVSRVLNDTGPVSPETRERVIQTAERLRYRPNMLMHSVRTGKTQSVGVLLNTCESFTSRVILGIHHTLAMADYMPVFHFWDPGDYQARDWPTLLQFIHRLVERRVDGLILQVSEETMPDECLHEIWSRNIPLVAVDNDLPKTQADFVGIDDEAGGRLVAQYLLRLGHRRLGVLAGSLYSSTGRLRRRGFEEAVKEVSGATCVTATSISTIEGEAAAEELLSSKSRPTAIFATTDYLARDLYRVAQKMRLRIPDDVSMIGFADIDFAKDLTPPLTTVNQFPMKVGQLAAELLLGRVEGSIRDKKPQRTRIQPELILRESVSPAN